MSIFVLVAQRGHMKPLDVITFHLSMRSRPTVISFRFIWAFSHCSQRSGEVPTLHGVAHLFEDQMAFLAC